MTYQKNKNYSKEYIYKWILSAISFVLLSSMGLKAVVDIDLARNWDTWAYHLPFAARIWRIVPAEEYILNNYWVPWYEGMAIFGEFLQGFFWYITGRPESTNLLSYFSLILYIYFLRSYFKIPFYLSTIALLAIPLVQTHATASYVDLPGSIGVSVLVMMTYRLYINPDEHRWQDTFILLIGAACAANMRLKLVPIVFIITSLAVVGILKNNKKRKGNNLKLSLILVPLLVVVFATPAKNTFRHGNPFYPVKVSIGNIELKHSRGNPEIPELHGIETTRPERWFYSVFEIFPRPFFRGEWSIDQHLEGQGNRYGGFFGAYVVLNLVFLGFLVYKIRSKETIYAAIIITIITIAAIFLPSSARLRYSIYWMMVLVSINLYLGLHFSRLNMLPKFINETKIGLVSGLVFIIVTSSTKAMYLLPKFQSFDTVMQKNVDQDLLKKIQSGELTCIPNKNMPFTFLYSSAFHPPKKYITKQCPS